MTDTYIKEKMTLVSADIETYMVHMIEGQISFWNSLLRCDTAWSRCENTQSAFTFTAIIEN